MFLLLFSGASAGIDFPTTSLVAANSDDDTVVFQFSETTLDGGFRNAYLGCIFGIIERSVLRNCLIQFLFYRVRNDICRVRNSFYRVKTLKFGTRVYQISKLQNHLLSFY